MSDNIENGEDRIELSNSAARVETIRNAVRYLADREAEINAIRDDINEYKQKHIKGDLGFKLSDWATVYRFYKLEDGDRDKFLDTLKESFSALAVGTQLDWVAAAEAASRHA